MSSKISIAFFATLLTDTCMHSKYDWNMYLFCPWENQQIEHQFASYDICNPFVSLVVVDYIHNYNRMWLPIILLSLSNEKLAYILVEWSNTINLITKYFLSFLSGQHGKWVDS